MPFRDARCCRTVGCGIPLPLALWFGLHGSRLCTEIEHPARNQASQNGNICNDNSDIVLDVVDAVVNRIRPVGLEKGVQSVTVGQVYFGGANRSDPGLC